jgi:hypothetical protein
MSYFPRECHRCGRILFPQAGGELPPHRVPQKAKVRGFDLTGATPLTGLDSPWCNFLTTGVRNPR